MSHPRLNDFRRIVVKVGSALLIDSTAGEVKAAWLSALVDDVAALHKQGKDVLIVSSGSIALGRSRLKLPRGTLKLEESQAAAAVGQIELARIWSEVLAAHGIGTGQILVTLQDTEERRRYLNARSTIGKLLEWRAVPVINENDTVATNEIRYGDNDRLAARVATMTSADLLVLLSDIDGLYDKPPNLAPNSGGAAARLCDVSSGSSHGLAAGLHSGRGAATTRPARCGRAARGRATGTCPKGRPFRGNRPNRCGRRRRPAMRTR